MKPRGAGKDFRQCFLNFLLNADADFLGLPTGVIRAVVGDGEFEFEQDFGRVAIQEYLPGKEQMPNDK